MMSTRGGDYELTVGQIWRSLSGTRPGQVERSSQNRFTCVRENKAAVL